MSNIKEIYTDDTITSMPEGAKIIVDDPAKKKLVGITPANAGYAKDFSANHLNIEGYLSSGNTFGTDAKYNRLGAECTGNTFGFESKYNRLGAECTGNTFGNRCDSNTFGNNVINNTFGNNALNNTFGSQVINLTVGDEFQFNTVESSINFTGIDFSSATHVYTGYHCRIFKDADEVIKLSYVDNAGNFTVVAVNA